ncbi:MAG: LuxR C-terminal-related transcriptional regulator [Bacteroidota bacterium]
MPTTNKSVTPAQFTKRQLEVMEAWSVCSTIAEAATYLQVSEHTVHTHLRRLRAKLKVHRTIDVYLYLLRNAYFD